MDRQRAINEFHNFVSKHFQPSSKRASPLGAGRGQFTETTEVNRDEVLKVFFRLNPKHAPYRVDVSESSGDQHTFPFIKHLWADTIGKPIYLRRRDAQPITMNPIIKVVSEHIDNGDKVSQIFDDYTDVGVTVRLKDGTEIIYPIAASDHNEFMGWYEEASDWWNQRQLMEQARSDWGNTA